MPDRRSASGVCAATVRERVPRLLARIARNARVARCRPAYRPVRAGAFDRTAGAHWSGSWHQDRVIAVRGRADLSGFANRSRKGAARHCEPSEAVLRTMLLPRIHLDRPDGETGAMEIATGTPSPDRRHGRGQPRRRRLLGLDMADAALSPPLAWMD